MSDEEFVRSPPNTPNTTTPPPQSRRTQSSSSSKLHRKSSHKSQSKKSHSGKPPVDTRSSTQGQRNSSSADGHVDQSQREEFQAGADKAREEARRERNDDQGERTHSRSASKKSSSGKEGQKQDHSLFVDHLFTNYPILTATFHEITSRLPISIPNPTELPVINKLPSPASLPIFSSIDARLDSILTRLDTAFPIIKSPPEHIVSQVAQLTDPWIAPANSWLIEHLPQSKRSGADDPAVRERRKAQGKTWAATVAPGEKSYAETAAPDNEPSSEQDKDKEAQSEMELHKTVAILLDAFDAQVERVEEARGYVAEVLLPGYVPLVGGWLGGKVKGKGKKTGEEGRSGKKRDSKNNLEQQVDNEGVTVVGGREL